MAQVVGIDSSTQSCKVVAVDSATGELLHEGSAPHPDGTSVDPREWITALESAWPDGLTAEAVAVGAQQHGMVALDAASEPVHPALLWNDTRSAPQASALAEKHGEQFWAERTGSVPVASFTVSKVAWLAEEEPDAAQKLVRLCLPHDWLNLHLSGEFFTDRSDASGTGYFSPQTNQYLPEILESILPTTPELPVVLDADGIGGRVREGRPGAGAVLSAGLGDNAAAAMGLGLEPGDVVVSVGTSGTVFARSTTAFADTSGAIAGFADGQNDFLPLLATINAARVLSATAGMLNVELPEFDRLARTASPDADGLVLVPYLDGERTPNLPEATGTLLGLSRKSMTAENLARAAVLGVLNSLADGVDALRAGGVQAKRIILIGGGAKSLALQQAAANVFGLPVQVPAAGEYVARGAARQAAWALTGELPDWPVQIASSVEPDADWGGDVREAYIAARKSVYGV